MRILLAEDDVSLSNAILYILEKNKFSADIVRNGADVVKYAESDNYDAMILDLVLPQVDGITILKTLREQGNNIPVLVLTGRSEIEDKVLGLDSGANDYMTKPFDTRELLARLRSITRTKATGSSLITVGNITLDRATFQLSSPTGCFRLANKEFQMMEVLMRNPNNLVSTSRFLEKIWGYDSDTGLNVVWVYISYLRKKLKTLNANIRIKAARNAGYSLVTHLEGDFD